MRLCELCWEGHGGLYKVSKQRIKGESDRLRGEGDKVTFITVGKFLSRRVFSFIFYWYH